MAERINNSLVSIQNLSVSLQEKAILKGLIYPYTVMKLLLLLGNRVVGNQLLHK